MPPLTVARRLAVPLLLSVTLAAGPAGAVERPSTGATMQVLAVLELRDQSGKLDPNFLALLADDARGHAAELLSGRGFRIIDRRNMVGLLKEMGKDSTCSEGDCDIETGRNIGASYIVTGDIVPDGPRFYLSMQLHETRMGTLRRHARRESKDKDGLFDAVQSATGALLRDEFGAGAGAGAAALGGAGAASEFTESQTMGPTAKRHMFTFSSTPSEATVRIDGSQICDLTPCTKNLAAGMHQVVIEKSRYEALRRQIVVSEAATSFNALLRPLFGTITFQPSERGVAVFLDGGSSPVSTVELDPGQHSAEIRDRCFLAVKLPFSVRAGETRSIPLKAERRMTQLSVDAKLRGNDAPGEVEVDGVRVGSLPYDGYVWACSQTVTVRSGDLPPWSKALDLGTKKSASVTADLDEFQASVEEAKRQAAEDERRRAEEARTQAEEEARPKLKERSIFVGVGTSRFKDYHFLGGIFLGQTVRLGGEFDVIVSSPVAVRSGLNKSALGFGVNLLLERSLGGRTVLGVSTGGGVSSVDCSDAGTAACKTFLSPDSDGKYSATSWYWSSNAYVGYYGEKAFIRGGVAYIKYWYDPSIVDMGNPLGGWLLVGLNW